MAQRGQSTVITEKIIEVPGLATEHSIRILIDEGKNFYRSHESHGGMCAKSPSSDGHKFTVN